MPAAGRAALERMGRYRGRGRAGEEGEGKEGREGVKGEVAQAPRQAGPCFTPGLRSPASSNPLRPARPARPAAATSSLVSAHPLRSNLQNRQRSLPPHLSDRPNLSLFPPLCPSLRACLDGQRDLYAETSLSPRPQRLPLPYPMELLVPPYDSAD